MIDKREMHMDTYERFDKVFENGLKETPNIVDDTCKIIVNEKQSQA